jgi:hypothetical protein
MEGTLEISEEGASKPCSEDRWEMHWELGEARGCKDDPDILRL